MTTLIWFRNDLRTADNPALTAAITSGQPVRAVFIRTPQQWRSHHWSEAKISFFESNITQLQLQLAHNNVPLTILDAKDFGESIGLLVRLCVESKITAVRCNQEFGINERRRDQQVARHLDAQQIRFERFPDQVIVPVDEIRTQNGDPFRVFTPFFKAWTNWLSEHPPTLYRAPAGEITVEATTVGDFESGEAAAHRILNQFLDERAGSYGAQRDFPALNGTSRISPYLAAGVLSGRQCWMAAQQRLGESPAAETGIRKWIAELAWRDFYLHILWHFPRVSMNRAFQPETDTLAWRGTTPAYEAWTRGETGIPIIDAAMRQLMQTHWMHNRLRMICAMYLTKNLFVDWRLGESWFMQHLIDGHLASNNGGWQWSASTGTDAAPYFRIFNPVSQSEKFDPEGQFIRQWVPEIAHLPDKELHSPWLAKRPPSNYPAPAVDLKQSRAEAIDRFRVLKQEAS